MSYTVQLLNDLHTYFPEVLYGDPNRFPNVQSLLEYIRHQARSIHDVFSNSRRNYVATAQQAQPVPHNDRITFSFNFDEVQPTRTLGVNEEMADPPVDIMRILQSIMQPPANFMESVIVRPTLQQIAANSTIVEITSEQACAICQENMLSTEPIRRLNYCHHLFHDDCISTWFQQNVHCPTCRHDIRV